MKNVWLGTVALAAFAIAGSVQAADLKGVPIYKAPPMATYNWTGFYFGANAGIGVSRARVSTLVPEIASERSGANIAGGIQGGFNWQFAPQWIAGIEGDIGFLETSRTVRVLAGPSTGFGVRTNGYATIRGRFGYTSGPSLFYATGGAAFVRVTNEVDRFTGGPSFSSKSETADGWTVGGGLETLVGGNWSGKVEYLYIDAGHQDVFSPIDNIFIHFDNRLHVFRYGLNYKFDGPAVVGALPVHNWTGLYAGATAGLALSQDHATAPVTLSPFLINGADDAVGPGFTGGVQAGYNWQFSPNLVAGLEGDIGWLGINHTASDGSVSVGVKADWFGTLRGRLGYSAGPSLLYVTAGGAFVNVKNTLDQNLAHVSASKSETAGGWTAGAGIETVLAQYWTAKIEYLYVDAGKQDVVNPALFAGHFENRFHVFRFGVNYHFGG